MRERKIGTVGHLSCVVVCFALIAIGNTSGWGWSVAAGELKEGVYLITGQSNAVPSVCDWEYFETITGYETIILAKGGRSIDELIAMYNSPDLSNVEVKGIIFIHGESDGIIITEPNKYIERVNHYRTLMPDVPFIISTVGYVEGYPDAPFDAIRQATKAQQDWIIGFDGARFFRDSGMLVDTAHFSPQGCKLMMDAMKAITGALNE